MSSPVRAVQSVELLLDEAADDWVRSLWGALLAANLPSQARHTGSSNAPHVTLTVRERIAPAEDAALAGLTAAALPLPLPVSGILVFPGRRATVALGVVVGPELLALHADVSRVLDPSSRAYPHLAPGSWTPHLTLATRVEPERLGDVLTVLTAAGAGSPPPQAAAVAVRRWDNQARRTWDLARRTG